MLLSDLGVFPVQECSTLLFFKVMVCKDLNCRDHMLKHPFMSILGVKSEETMGELSAGLY